jgi:hypothetical protein
MRSTERYAANPIRSGSHGAPTVFRRPPGPQPRITAAPGNSSLTTVEVVGMTGPQPVRARRAMPFFWWQHERGAQLCRADDLAARREEHRAGPESPEPGAAAHLPAAG